MATLLVSASAVHAQGVRPAESHVEHPHLLDLLARPNASGAQNAERHVVLDHDVAGPLVAVPEAEFLCRLQRDVVLHHVPLELVSGPAPAAVPEVLGRIPLEEEREHPTPSRDHLRRFGVHHHPIRRRRVARGHQLRLALDRDQADPAVGDDRELRIPAERRNLDALGAGDVEDGRTGLELVSSAVQREGRHERVPREGTGRFYPGARE